MSEASVIKCITCSAEFTPARPWQKYCTVRCQRNAPGKAVRTRRFQAERRELINAIKVERGCAECGYNAHPAALDFNHVRGEKIFNVSQDPKVALHRLKAEIDKCDVLCANCHRVHTYERRHWHTKRKGAA
jgi:hypothetical protein